MRPLLLLACAGMLLAADADYQDFDSRAMLGINMTPPSSTTSAANGTEPTLGVEVQNVYPGTAADRMGLEAGDLITSFNGGDIGSMNDLRNEVALSGVGGQASVEVMRKGQKIVLNDALGQWPENIPYQPIDEAAERRFRDWQSRRLDRTQQAVAALRQQVEDLERQANATPDARPAQSLSPADAMALPASQALAALPAFRVRLRLAHDLGTAPHPAASPVSWDARVLIGSPIPEIH